MSGSMVQKYFPILMIFILFHTAEVQAENVGVAEYVTDTLRRLVPKNQIRQLQLSEIRNFGDSSESAPEAIHDWQGLTVPYEVAVNSVAALSFQHLSQRLLGFSQGLQHLYPDIAVAEAYLRFNIEGQQKTKSPEVRLYRQMLKDLRSAVREVLQTTDFSGDRFSSLEGLHPLLVQMILEDLFVYADMGTSFGDVWRYQGKKGLVKDIRHKDGTFERVYSLLPKPIMSDRSRNAINVLNLMKGTLQSPNLCQNMGILLRATAEAAMQLDTVSLYSVKDSISEAELAQLLPVDGPYVDRQLNLHAAVIGERLLRQCFKRERLYERSPRGFYTILYRGFNDFDVKNFD